ncbi:MmcQ/YjbR family DNA-binding protein [Actinomadura sp. 21ATH]|uniref:MmcQ/YjbR family DNA-binding protein n=1 Tax=Actinomadura sp. 21ATH TaxID=1735444 RepID=UPI0035C007DD
MDGKALQDTALQRAEELPATTLYSFEPGWEAARVAGKWFMLLTEVPGRPVVIVKSRPGDAQALCEAYTDITPGYHMNKRHWITLAPGDSLDKKLVRELVTESYRLVVANLPKARRPVDPARFGTG